MSGTGSPNPADLSAYLSSLEPMARAPHHKTQDAQEPKRFRDIAEENILRRARRIQARQVAARPEALRTDECETTAARRASSKWQLSKATGSLGA